MVRRTCLNSAWLIELISMSKPNLFKQPWKRWLLVLFLCVSIASAAIWFMDLPTALTCRQIRKHLTAGEIDQAMKLSKQLAASKPECAECQFLLAKSARRNGDFLTAAKSLQNARAANWDPQLISYERVLATAQSGKVRSVEGELRQIFQRDLKPSETEEIYEALASGHLAAYDAPEFLRCIDFWLEWDSSSTKPRQMRAEFYFRLGDYRRAADLFQALVDDHPELLPARKGLGDSLLALNLSAEAENELRICYEHDRSAQNALSLAKCLVRTDRPDEAKALLEKFKTSEDRVTRAEILEELGRWLLYRQQLDQAFEYLQECVHVAPENFSGWHALSTAYSMKGDREKAAEALKVSQDSQRRAQRLYAIAMELSNNPQSIALRLEAAEIMFTLGRDQDAIAWLTTILHIDERNRDANQRLAVYYERSGDVALAEKHRQMAGFETSGNTGP